MAEGPAAISVRTPREETPVRRIGGAGPARSGLITRRLQKVMKRAMQVWAETYLDKDGVEKLRRIWFDSRQIEVSENIDQWHGKNYRYFKVKSSDGAAYILRHNESGNDWELTMYEHTPPHGDSAFPKSKL